jgi:hypothetical protein
MLLLELVIEGLKISETSPDLASVNNGLFLAMVGY